MFWKRKDTRDKGLSNEAITQARAFHDKKEMYRPLTDKHFELSHFIEARYKERDTDPQALDEVIRACEEMIFIAPEVAKAFRHIYEGMNTRAVPRGHRGYHQLIIIRKKQKNLEEAARLEQEFKKVWH